MDGLSYILIGSTFFSGFNLLMIITKRTTWLVKWQTLCWSLIFFSGLYELAALPMAEIAVFVRFIGAVLAIMMFANIWLWSKKHKRLPDWFKE